MNSPNLWQMTDNELLAKLNRTDLELLAPHITVNHLNRNFVLQASGEDVRDTWFPCGSSVASFQLWADDDAHAVEVALIGREGAIGGIVSHGRLPAYATAVVRVEGQFLCIKTAALEQARLESIALRHWFSRYSDCFIAQVFQNAVCNATHTIAQRTAKWLLATQKRTGRREIEVTHEQLAEILGVGRAFVSRVVREFRDQNIIKTKRALFVLENTNALKTRACSCLDHTQRHYDVVLGEIYGAREHNR